MSSIEYRRRPNIERDHTFRHCRPQLLQAYSDLVRAAHNLDTAESLNVVRSYELQFSLLCEAAHIAVKNPRLFSNSDAKKPAVEAFGVALRMAVLHLRKGERNAAMDKIDRLRTLATDFTLDGALVEKTNALLRVM